MCYINAAAEEQPAETAVPVRVTGSVRESGEEKVPPGPQPAAASVGTADGTQVIAPATDGSSVRTDTGEQTQNNAEAAERAHLSLDASR
jgi:hypothetical protein